MSDETSVSTIAETAVFNDDLSFFVHRRFGAHAVVVKGDRIAQEFFDPSPATRSSAATPPQILSLAGGVFRREFIGDICPAFALSADRSGTT